MTTRCPSCGQTTGSLCDLTDAERDELVREMAAELQVVEHTDHPLRHYDRTCPACNADAALPPTVKAAQAVADAGGLDNWLADPANKPTPPVGRASFKKAAEFVALLTALEAAVFASDGDPAHPEVVTARNAVRAAVQGAILAEREECARFIEAEYVRQFARPWREDLAAAIRAG